MLVLYINLKNRLYKTDQFETTARIRKIMINSCQLIYILVLFTFFSSYSTQRVEVIDQDPEDEHSVKHTFKGRTFYLGLIHDDAENTPEEIVELNKIYMEIGKKILPKSYDSRELGKYIEHTKVL